MFDADVEFQEFKYLKLTELFGSSSVVKPNPTQDPQSSPLLF